MDDLFAPFDFSAIAGYPHALPEKALEKLPTFQGNNAISAKTHLKAFSLCINKWCNAAQHNHQDVKMKLFALSLEDEAFDWFSNLEDSKYPTLSSLVDHFMDKWGDKREGRHALTALHTIKKSENETMIEFNKRFNDLISSMHKDIKPSEASTLIYYIEAFSGDFDYELRDKDPTTLASAQSMAIKIERNMQASGKSILPGFTRGSSSKHSETKDKTDSKASAKDPLKELTEMIKTMELNHAAQLNAMQNRLIAMERSQNNRFQSKPNKDWQRKGPQDQRPPNPLDSANLVQDEIPPYCRACRDFHDEASCHVFLQINEQGIQETNNFVGHPYRNNSINVLGKTYPISTEQMKKVKEASLKADHVRRLYGEKPSPFEILEMANNRYKGVTYKEREMKS